MSRLLCQNRKLIPLLEVKILKIYNTPDFILFIYFFFVNYIIKKKSQYGVKVILCLFSLH